MIQFKIYNDDRIRTFHGFPTMKDPNVLENTLLKIINEYCFAYNLPLIDHFDINNPQLANLYFPYYTTSNLYAWGQLPLYYIYNDMIRHIQNQNTSNNFIMTLESIYYDGYKEQYINTLSYNYLSDIASAYITENYLTSYYYMTTNNNGILTIFVPHMDGGGIIYIISVGFSPLSMNKWLCTDKGSLVEQRRNSIKGIVSVKSDYYFNLGIYDKNNVIYYEYENGTSRESLDYCSKIVKKLDISNLRKKSEFDTEIKYGNFPIDYNYLGIYDNAYPIFWMTCINKDTNFVYDKSSNMDANYNLDPGLYKFQNNIIKTYEKKKGVHKYGVTLPSNTIHGSR